MDWIFVETQNDLESLSKTICWHDSSCIEFYATNIHEPYFPSEVNRSGYTHHNIHTLLEICNGPTEYLEMVWIHCDHFTFHFLQYPFIQGRVDSLKRIEIVDFRGDLHMRCSRLIYRFLKEEEVRFISDWNISEGLFLKSISND